jgi:SAM-dependent methyltransferase
MPSKIRETVFKTMEIYNRKISPENKQWNVLEIGIDGDSKPGGNYKYFGIGNNYKTLDILERTGPDIIADICNNDLPSEEWDLIIMSQVIEHIFDFKKALEECHRLLVKGGFLIVDCPFVCDYHGQSGYDDYWRISHKALQNLLNDIGFEYGNCGLVDGILTSAIARKSINKIKEE